MIGYLMRAYRYWSLFVMLWVAALAVSTAQAQVAGADAWLSLETPRAGDTLLANRSRAPDILVDPEAPETIKLAAHAFTKDLQRVTGAIAEIMAPSQQRAGHTALLVGVLHHSATIDALTQAGCFDPAAIEGKWESAIVQTVTGCRGFPQTLILVAGSDRRGAAFALFTLSRQMGVSPWVWWADVPPVHHRAVYIRAGMHLQREPSVQYRGIFLNDEDWGLRPWAAAVMDPEVRNVGPHTYVRIFELLLRLRANTLLPAMHPGTLAFNATAENAALADRWGIVMSSSHSEALLRNNVGEWDEKRDGPWNFQINHDAIVRYWDKRLEQNGRYENFYTMGMRGVHDTGLEAEGSTEIKARLLEQVMQAQRDLLLKRVGSNITHIPQMIWLYKESLELYRAGMRIPDDITLGWTDDNYGYIRQLPNEQEQRRAGGSGVYYHVSYWGFPHDYLWLCTTPPALIREEMTKAFDHGVRRFWVLNVGDLKPAELDMDYFMQLGWDEQSLASVDQPAFLRRWASEQFPPDIATAAAALLDRYYRLNFIRKPEFMGFNGYDDGVQRARFNPLAWGDQNRQRSAEWGALAEQEKILARKVPAAWHDAFFELVGYPIEAAAAQNVKFLATDHSFLDASTGDMHRLQTDTSRARGAYEEIQRLTARYNALGDGKWKGIMSAAPRQRHVFEMPATATAADKTKPLPAFWGAGLPLDHAQPGITERLGVVSINATHTTRRIDGPRGEWRTLSDLGISPGGSILFGSLDNAFEVEPGEDAPMLEYSFTTSTQAPATLTLYMLPTFPVDSSHRLRYGVQIDDGAPFEMDASESGEWHETSAPVWADNVLRNAATGVLSLPKLTAGKHTLRLLYRDPAVIFEHIVLSWPQSAPAYPVPPETTGSLR